MKRENRLKKVLILSSTISFLVWAPAIAQPTTSTSSVHVTDIQPGDFPNAIFFGIDADFPNPIPSPIPGAVIPCRSVAVLPRGSDATSKLAYMEAMLSILLSAYLTGKTVQVDGNIQGPCPEPMFATKINLR